MNEHLLLYYLAGIGTLAIIEIVLGAIVYAFLNITAWRGM